MKNKRLVIFLLISILCLGAFLRLYRLSSVPNGFIPEEVSTGWNAYSLLHTGKDEWGVTLPIVFKETGGYKLALGSYLVVPSIAVFGMNEFGVRFPTVIAGLLTVFLTFIYVNLIWKNKAIALAAAFLLAINPWHISMNRYNVDVNWGIPLFLSGLIFFNKSLKKPQLLLYSGLFFGLTFYTYFNYIVFVGLFIIFLLIWQRKFFLKNLIWSGIFLGILGFMMLPYLVNPTLFIRFSQATSVSNIGFINRINEHRQPCELMLSKSVCRLIYNKPTERFIEIFRNWVGHYSTATYFLYGSEMGLSGMPQRWGLFYLFEFVFLIYGFVKIIQKKLFSPGLIFWSIAFGIPGSLASEGHIWRMLTLLPLPQIVAGVGLVEFWNYCKKYLLAKFTIAIIISFFLFKFMADYFIYFPFAQAKNDYYGFRDLYTYLKTQESKYDAIYVSPGNLNFAQLYIYYLFYVQPDPFKYQQGIDVERVVGDEGWVAVKRIGKWNFDSEYRNFIPKFKSGSLLVTDNVFKEDAMNVNLQTVLLHQILNPDKSVAFKVFAIIDKPTFQTNTLK